MATRTFNADSAEASGVDVTKVGSTFVISGANPVITLDTIDYGVALAGDNSTAAESLSGGTVPWLPTDISSTMVWHSAKDFTSSGTVSTWADKTTNGNDATQGTPADEPDIVNFGSADVAVQGDVTKKLNYLSQILTSAASASVFIMATPTGSNGGWGRIGGYDGGGIHTPFSNGRLYDVSFCSTYQLSNTSVTFPVVAKRMFSFEQTGTAIRFRADGVQVDSDIAATFSLDTNSALRHLFGEIGSYKLHEVVICDTLLSDSDREKMEGYLEWEWGTESRLDSGHPYKSSAPTNEGTAPTATYQTTDDEPPTNFVPVTPENLTALRARANTGNQTESRKIYLTGDAGGIWNSFSIDTYTPDVTPPADPTGGKQVAGDRWGMWWDQSPEGITTVSRLRRTIDGTNYYLANVAGLAEWVSTTPTTWWIFSRGLSTANSQSNSWEEANVVATTISYSTQHVDEAMLNSEWVGFVESGAGSAPVAPILNGLTVSDGTITINVTANSESDVVYGRVRRNSPAYSWEARNVGFSITGSGTISITGLINGIEYEVAAQTVIGGASGIGSDFAGSRFAAPDADAFATSRYNGKINRRNRTALASLQVCQRLGVKIDFTNIQGSTSVNIYAMVDEAATSTIGVRTGDIDGSAVVLIVPRQTNFPPEKILPNSIITLNTKVYQIDRWSSDVEDINMASTWKLYCSVSGDCYGY